MIKILLKPWLFVLVGWIGMCAVVARPAAAQSYPPAAVPHRMISDSGKASIFDTFTSSVKESMGKFTRMVTPKIPTKPADDPVTLSSKGKPSAELYTAVAHMYEKAGKNSEAAEQYQKALRLSPEYLGALLGYARLNDQLGRTAEAEKLHRRAVESHPNETSAYNNLALFYARHGRPGDSVVVLGRAIRMEPKNPKYRNNIATVLVEMGRNKEAFDHLRTVHGAAAAYYNLGYLLEKKGQTQAAEQHFAIAGRLDPSLAKAKHKPAQMKQPTNKTIRSVPNHLARRPEPGVRQLSTPPQTQNNRTAPRNDRISMRFDTPPMPPTPRHHQSVDALKRLPPLTGGGSISPAMAPLPPVVQHWNPNQSTPASSAIQPLPPLH